MWNGLGTARRLERMRRPSSSTSTASTARAWPPITDCSGAFSAHTHTCPANGSIAAATSSRLAITESIAPCFGPNCSTAAARACVARAPSAKLQAPAATSEGNSPKLWLAITSGWNPIPSSTVQARRSARYIPHWVSQTTVPMPLPGCQAISARVSSPAARASLSSRSTAWRAAADSAGSPRNISVYCDPCPGKSAATRGRKPAGASALARNGAGETAGVAATAAGSRAAAGTGSPLSMTT